MALKPTKAKSTGASGKYKTYARGESGTKSGTGGGTPKSKSSYPQVESARTGGGGGGSYTLKSGVEVQQEEGTSYRNVEVEREELVKEASARGEATAKQEKEANKVKVTQDKNFQAYSQQVKEYETGLKRQGVQDAREYYAAVQGERSPRESQYSQVVKEREELLKKKPAPTLFNKEKYYTNEEIGPREKAVIKVAEFAVQKEKERAERYEAFEQRIEPLNAFQKGGLKLGYAVSVGFGETLSSVGLKTFVTVGALTSQTLRPLATTEAKRAAGETVQVLKEEYNPKTVKGITNIGITALAIYGLGRYRAANRANKANQVTGEPIVSDKIKNKFNLKDKDVSPSSGKVTSTEQQKTFYTKTGEQETILAQTGKVSKTGEVLTERGSITTPKPGKTATTIYPDKPGAKVTIQYAATGKEGITTTTRKGIIYNYERLSYTRKIQTSKILESPLGKEFNKKIPVTTQETISRFYKTNKLTGKRTYLGASKSTNTAEIKLLEPRPAEVQTFKQKGTNPSLSEKSTQITEGLSNKRAGLKLEVQTETITSTKAKSVPSKKPGALKNPAQSPSATVEKTQLGTDTTPFKTKIKLTKKGEAITQPKQEIKIDLEKPSITTKTPAIIETTTQQATQTKVRLSFNNKNLGLPTEKKPLIRIKFKPDKYERPITTIKVKKPTKSNTQEIVQPELTTTTRTVNTPILQTPTPTTPSLSLPPDVKTQSLTITAPPSISRIEIREATPSLKIDNRPEITFKPITENIYKREIINPPSSLNRIKTEQNNILQNDFLPRTKTAQRTITTTKTAQQQTPSTTPTIITEQIQKSNTTPTQIIRLTKIQQPKPPPSTPPPGAVFFDNPEPETARAGNFKTLVRRQGKFKVIGTSTTEAEAKRLGELRVKDTAAASFKIEMGGEVQEVSAGFGFTRSKKERGVIIQPRERRISTAGEKQEITYQGIRETKAKKGRKNILNLFGGM